MLRNALRSARTRAPSTCDRWSGNACSLRLRKCCKGHREIEWHPQTHFGIEPQLTHEQPQSIIILILKRNLEGLQCGSSGKPDRYCIKAAITDSIVKQRERVRQHHRGAMRPGLASMATPDKNRRAQGHAATIVLYLSKTASNKRCRWPAGSRWRAYFEEHSEGSETPYLGRRA